MGSKERSRLLRLISRQGLIDFRSVDDILSYWISNRYSKEETFVLEDNDNN